MDWRSESLPARTEINSSLYRNPKQTPTNEELFTQTYDGKSYVIDPKYDYTLHGLVVSHRDLDDEWFNTYYDSDPINIKDLCVIWGGNLASDIYRKVKYDSGLWTCYVWFRNDDETA